MTVRHIVLDIGRVLLKWDPELPYRRLIPDPERRRWFLSEVCTPAWNHAQDGGRSWAEGEAELIARFPAEADLIRAYRATWCEMVPEPLAETPQIMADLVAAGHDVTLLTNFHPETFAIALQRFPFLQAARGRTVSGEVGITKPDPAIYALHARRFGLEPAATLFFDDSAANVAAAEAAGWTGRLFTDAARMRADLAATGVAY
ncbi:HAD-IA family hydrolase [Acuticoccus mangrovi]|uniref:HAD-IA family hydrolase n=1 Tax=Acuticoccus mangrovi TaxID=2796142 RepID=A0A934IMP1_9HYPH|nr:HAD-IA family hydrolase [Acuticoccus mangrovi]MBJ3775193.1 HAD-IA family hydrolase [Acuticoccus mangrovi]